MYSCIYFYFLYNYSDNYTNVPSISIILKLSAPPDYQGFMESWESTSGSYVIDPFGDRQQLVTVYCDMETENGGWTVQIVISFYFFYLSLPTLYFYPPFGLSTIPFYPFFFSFFLSSFLITKTKYWLICVLSLKKTLKYILRIINRVNLEKKFPTSSLFLQHWRSFQECRSCKHWQF